MKKQIIVGLGLAIMVTGCFEKKAERAVLKLKGAKEDQELMAAIDKGNVESITEALRKGANPNAEIDGQKMLYLAIKTGKKEIVERLIDAGANKDEVDKKNGYTVLSIAAFLGHAQIVDFLLKAGVNTETACSDGTTALIASAIFGNAEVVDILLKAGANKEAKGKNGLTALIAAAAFGHAKVLDILLKAGANKESVGGEGFTALLTAAEFGNLEVVGILLKAGANKEAVNKDGKTALLLATEKGHFEIIKLLYKNFANVNASDISKSTAIGHLFCLATENDKYKPLFISIINHELKILRKLFQIKFVNLSVKIKNELKKIDVTLIKKSEPLKALTMAMQCDDLIRDEIFKNAVEMLPVNRYVIENTQLKIDETIFKICLKNIKKRRIEFTSEDIINLFIIEILSNAKTGAWCPIL